MSAHLFDAIEKAIGALEYERCEDPLSGWCGSKIVDLDSVLEALLKVRHAGTDFHLGDEVEWTSQAAGRARTKRGTIAQVVMPGGVPARQFTKLHQGSGIGMSRRHESYVVIVGTKQYWPLVAHLKRV